MFGGGDGPSNPTDGGPQAPQAPQMPPKKLFRVHRFSIDQATPPGTLETLTIEAHFMAPLDRGGMAFNIYDFETPQGVSTIRVLNDYYDIEQLAPTGIIH